MSKQGFRLLVGLSILSLLLASAVVAPASATSWMDKVDPWVVQTATTGETEFLLSLTYQADLSGANALPTKSQKGWYVYQTLTSFAERTQAPLIAELERLAVQYRPYWLTNMIWVRGDLGTIQLLANRPDVAHLYANPRVALDEPLKEISLDANPQGVEWNITHVNAPDVWALGFTGQGTLIGGADTGYDWEHPALKNQYRGWDGAVVNHDYNWFDATAEASPVPVDPNSHGTHTMGTMVGDDGDSNQIGMAPGARWIGCRNMDASGNGTPQTYIACYQWFVAPTRVDGTEPRTDLAPDVINNSWYCPPAEGCTEPNMLLTAVQNLVAAGIVSVHSAGNEGNLGCESVEYPAAIYAESFSVGATDSTDAIASFSSRGPVTVDESGRIKPDISAPGVGIYSSVPGGGYGSLSGTSMASPHVAGLVALFISAHPSLRGQVDQIESIIEQTALHIPSTLCDTNGIPNNVYGWGRIDALAAVESVHRLELKKIASAPFVEPGDTITYTLSITHSLGNMTTTHVVLTDTIPSGTVFISATPPYTQTGDVIQWGFPALDVLDTRSVNLTVQVNITAAGTITNTDYDVQSDQVAMVHGIPVDILVRKLFFLPMTIKGP